MIKKEVYDKVVLYRDIFSEEEVNLIRNTILESEDDVSGKDFALPEDSSYIDYHGPDPIEKDDGTIIKSWSTWYNYGKKTFFSNNIDKDLSDVGQKQVLVRKLILDGIAKAHKDYFSSYEKNSWPEYAGRDFSLDNGIYGMAFSDIEVLQHRINDDSEFTIDIHTDWHEQRHTWPGPKQIVTYTFYLNDDYAGGEVDFISENQKSMTTYKPKMGDITVFPSGRPYWHSARAANAGSNKIFIRVFACKQYVGSSEWHEGSAKHGIENWLQKEKEKVLSFVNDGETSRRIVVDGKDNGKFPHLLPLFIDNDKIFYIDGREVGL
jgi:hypothetical protein